MICVVFKCPKCGKGTYNQIRDQSKIGTKSYKCYRCNKSSAYSKIRIFSIEDKVTNAVNIARRVDLNSIEELSLEEKQAWAKIGEQKILRRKK